jgi:hypothetical protein
MIKLNSALMIFLITGFISLNSCEKAGRLCGGNDPKNDLPWLKVEISRLSSQNKCYTISRSSYNTETVFIISSCEANINSVPLLYRCNGTLINLSESELKGVKFTGKIELIWKSNG